METPKPSKRRKLDRALPDDRRRQRNQSTAGSVRLRPLDPDAPITLKTSIVTDGAIRLRSDRIYTIGRTSSRCEIAFGGNRCIGKRHCQLLLDGVRKKLLLADGLFSGNRRNSSTNGVFVNGRRLLPKGSVRELSVGDEVCFACAKTIHRDLRCTYGFVVESVAYFDAYDVVEHRDGPVGRALLLLSICRNILHSMDPISRIRRSLDVVGTKKIRAHKISGKQNLPPKTSVSSCERIKSTCEVSPRPDIQFGDDGNLQPEKDGCCGFPSDGKKFLLNRLEFMDQRSSESRTSISLQELFEPVGSLLRVFIATFTCDIAWFLSYCKVPNHLPMTIACHNSEKCWSASHENRSSIPYSDYPNLVMLYPPFPEEIAFGRDRNRRGVGCHHPKLLLLQRVDTIRVVITSANLVSRQWNNITNTVWWQDFPRRDTTDFSDLFFQLPRDYLVEDLKSDFAAQLAGFIASLIAGLPTEAYWVVELAKYDFGAAAGYLVASVPGIHIKAASTIEPEYTLSVVENMAAKPSKFKFIGYVQASVVGLSYRFRTTNDSNGTQLRTLASYLRKCPQDAHGLSEVILRRITNMSVDANAISVLVPYSDGYCTRDNLQLGFLPKDVAKWVSSVSDEGFFSFSAFIFPKEAIAAAREINSKVELILHVSQGPNFSDISGLIRTEHFGPLCTLLASIQRCVGLWRLEEVLHRYSWPEYLENDFIYGSSSIGTSVSPQYLASFSAAIGKKSLQFSDSQESDPEWGRWTINHELEGPSLNILFPTVKRVKNQVYGIRHSRSLLAFSEKTWKRLKSSSILHDAVPNPPDRIGYPMHVKVAYRRFQSKKEALSFGWVYSGSHNFSPAAWGHLLQFPSVAKATIDAGDSALRQRLHICNYELGIILVSSPSNMHKNVEKMNVNLDNIVLPFLMPPPIYDYNDQPATVQAMRELAVFEKENHVATINADEVMDEEISDEEEIVNRVIEENEEEKIYAETLWSQADLSDCE